MTILWLNKGTMLNSTNNNGPPICWNLDLHLKGVTQWSLKNSHGTFRKYCNRLIKSRRLKKNGMSLLTSVPAMTANDATEQKKKWAINNTWWFTSQLLRAGKSRTRKDRNHLKEQHEDWNSNCQFVDEYCLCSLRQPCHEGIGKGFHVTPFYSETKNLSQRQDYCEHHCLSVIN